LPTPKQIEDFIKSMMLPSSIIDTMLKQITISFDLGVQNIEKLVNQNIMDVNPEVIEFIKNYNFDLVKNMNDDLAVKLRDTLSRGLMDGKSATQMTKDVKNIFDTTMARASSISRTETARAFGMGQFAAAEKSKIKLVKYWLAVHDNRTTPLCQRLARKYDRENAIPVDRKFKDDVSGWVGLTNPSHINCRSEAIYIPISQ